MPIIRTASRLLRFCQEEAFTKASSATSSGRLPHITKGADYHVMELPHLPPIIIIEVWVALDTATPTFNLRDSYFFFGSVATRQ